ncbi:uncharacterized protein METZ01_LOCUS445722, partial [marine metagenome]
MINETVSMINDSDSSNNLHIYLLTPYQGGDNMDEEFSEIAKALMPYETSNNALSKPEARGLEWLSEQLANERCSWTLHESGLI